MSKTPLSVANKIVSNKTPQQTSERFTVNDASSTDLARNQASFYNRATGNTEQELQESSATGTQEGFCQMAEGHIEPMQKKLSQLKKIIGVRKTGCGDQCSNVSEARQPEPAEEVSVRKNCSLKMSDQPPLALNSVKALAEGTTATNHNVQQ